MSVSYQIKLPQFEGPFDLLLFFIERDELDIYNIPIHGLTKDFLVYIHELESLNIELASEFILFISTLMRIKAKMLLPRKELDAQGNEIDPLLGEVFRLRLCGCKSSDLRVHPHWREHAAMPFELSPCALYAGASNKKP